MKYYIEKIRNGLWRLAWENGETSDHSTQQGAEKAAFMVYSKDA